MTIEILMTGPMKPIERDLEPDFKLHRLWLENDRDAFLDAVGERIRGVVTYSGAHFRVDAALLAKLPKLEIVANMGVGYETVDVDLTALRGIIVTNAGSVNAVDVAEHAFGLVLDVARNIAAGDRYVRAGRWAGEGRMKMTHRVSGRKLGILGLGHIGLEIAKRAEAFDMPVFYHNRRPRTDVSYGFRGSPVALATEVDVLVVATPGGPETRHLVDRAVLDALGPEGFVVNIARGTVIDEPALVSALAEKRIAGAGLDVFADEPHVPEALFGMENVVLQPHQAGATYEGVEAAVALVGKNLRLHFAGEKVLTPVN